MPVGTQGSVKAVSSRELREVGSQVVLGNTYHLFVRPGLDVIRKCGGLHQFMNWDGPILTDSGGYQIFSLAKLRKINEEGVHFQNHVDGAAAFISPESAMQIQAGLGSDIAMVLDECPPWPCERQYIAQSLEMTYRWAERSRNAWTNGFDNSAATSKPSGAIFGIVQGGTFEDLRKQAAQGIVGLGFDGYAIGGVSVGEPEAEILQAVEWSEPYLPEAKPRYVMGLGTPPQLIELIARGMDMFDCVLPTRLARNATVFTSVGTLNLRNAEHTAQTGPLEEGCSCEACHGYSRAYLRHLIKAGEILGLLLLTIHNLHFYLQLMDRARRALENGSFSTFRSDFVAGYRVHTEALDLPN